MRFTLQAISRHIRKHHPGCPDFAVTYISEKIASRDWEDISLGGAVGATMQGILRHSMTKYDTLLQEGIDRLEARRMVQPRVEALLKVWAVKPPPSNVP